MSKNAYAAPILNAYCGILSTCHNEGRKLDVLVITTKKNHYS